MFEKDEFAILIAEMFLRTKEFENIPQRQEMRELLIRDFGGIPYNTDLFDKRHELEKIVAYRSIKFAIKYLNELIKS